MSRGFQRAHTALILAIGLAFLAPVAAQASPTGSATHVNSVTPPSGGKLFKPAGHGQLTPKQVSTDTVPQTKSTSHGTVPYRPAPPSSIHVTQTQPVAKAPVAPPPPALAVKKSFQGQSENGWQPSDSNGAPGTKNYVEVVNEQFEVYSKAGVQQYGTSLQTWYGSSDSIFDPVVQWDTVGQRMIFMADDNGTSERISVALQTNAKGSYCNYNIPTLSGYFADYDKMGIDGDHNGVYFSVNEYPNQGQPFTNELFYLNISEMESCQTVNYTYWYGLTNPYDGSIAFAIAPSHEEQSTGGVEYMVNSWPGGGCQFTIWQLYSNTSLYAYTLPTNCYSPPPNATQHGSSGLIDVGDDRMYEAEYNRGEMLFSVVGTVNWNDGNGNVGAVDWFRVNPATVSVNSQGAFGTPGYWLFYPSIAETDVGRIGFVYDASGPSNYPSLWAISGCLCDTVAVANGTSYYGTSGSSRWGDYQSNYLDPVYNIYGYRTTLWVTGQYAQATNYWGTWVMRFTPHK